MSGILAMFDESPSSVTVNSVFGSATAEVAGKPGNGKGHGKGQNK